MKSRIVWDQMGWDRISCTKNRFNEGLPVGFFIPVKDTLGEDHVFFSKVYIEIIGIPQKEPQDPMYTTSC